MTAQHPYCVTRAVRSPPMRGSKPFDGVVKAFPTATKRGVCFDESVPKTRDDIRRDANTLMNTKRKDERDDANRERPRNTPGRRGLSPPSVEARLYQHVENFVTAIGGPMAEWRHLLQLLQLEFRDVVRRSEEAEAEAACLRDRVRHVESCRREKDAADRASFAGMVLAHSDASAELRSRLRVAGDQLRKSEAERQAQTDELQAQKVVIGELERKVAQLVTSEHIKHERENRARVLWEQRISAKWEAYWAVRRPKAEDVPIAESTGLENTPEATNTKVVAAAACCRSPVGNTLSTTQQTKSTLTEEHRVSDIQSSRGDRLYVREEEDRHEGAAAAAPRACHCVERRPRKTSEEHASRASTLVSNAVAARGESGAAPLHPTTRFGRSPAPSSTGPGSKPMWVSSSASERSSPSLSFNQCTTPDGVRNDEDFQRDETQDAASSSYQQWPRRTTGDNTHHQCGSGRPTIAANGPHPGSPRAVLSTRPSALGVNARTPSRYREYADGGDGRTDLAVTSAAAVEGVTPTQHHETSGRSRPHHSGRRGHFADSSATTSSSPEQHPPVVAVESPQRPQHQPATQAIDGRWIGSSPSSSITPTAGRNRFPQQATRRHPQLEHGEEEEEPFRPPAKIAHGRGGEGLVAPPAPAMHLVGEGGSSPRGVDGREEGREDCSAFVSAADVAAAAETVALSFALGSPGCPNSLIQQHQQNQPSGRQQYQHQDDHYYHQGQHLSPLSSLSCATEIRTLPRSGWRSPSSVPVVAAVDPAASSEYNSEHACGSFGSSSRSRSSCFRPCTTGSGHFSDSPRLVSPASGPRLPPQGSPSYDERVGGHRLWETVRSTTSEPAPGKEPWLASRPRPGEVVASRSTPRSYASSHGSAGCRTHSRTESAYSSSSGSAVSSAAENTPSIGSSVYVSSCSRGSAPGSGSSASPSRPRRRPMAGGCGSRGGSESSIGYAQGGLEKAEAPPHLEMASPPPSPLPPPPPPPVYARHEDRSASPAASSAYPITTIGSRVSSRSSLFGEKLDHLSASQPSQQRTMDHRNREEEHRQTQQGQGQQGYSSSPSPSPLWSSLASPPPTSTVPLQGIRHHQPSSPGPQRHHHLHHHHRH